MQIIKHTWEEVYNYITQNQDSTFADLGIALGITERQASDLSFDWAISKAQFKDGFEILKIKLLKAKKIELEIAYSQQGEEDSDVELNREYASVVQGLKDLDVN